jgi:hypothetical protein
MGCDDQSVPDPGEVIEGKEKTDARLPGSSMFDFDLAEIVISQEKAAAGRCRHRDDVAFTLGDQAGQRRIVSKDVVHFTLQTARKALSPAAQRGTFGADVMKNSIGKRKKDVFQIVCCCCHEASQSITKWPSLSGRYRR